MISKNIGLILFDLSLLMINIVLYIPRLFISLLVRDKSIMYMLPLFFAIISVSLIPPYNYDLFRINHNYTNYLLYNEFQYVRDLYLYSLFFVGKWIGLNPGFLTFISCYLIYFSSLKLLFSNKNLFKFKNIEYFALVLIILLSVSVIQYTGIRFSSALAFLLLSCHYHFNNRNKKAILFLLLSIITHISIVILLPMLFLSSRLKNKKKARYKQLIFLLIMFVLGFFSNIITDALIYIVNMVNNILGWSFISISTYISGEWGVDRNSALNSTGQMVSNLNVYMTCMFMFSILFITPRNIKLFNIYVVLAGFTFLLQQYSTIFDRYSQVCIIYIIVLIVYIPKGRSTYAYMFLFMLYFLFLRIIDIRNNIDFLLTGYADLYNHSFINTIIEVIQ